jgi:serine/threonine protein kinase
MSLPDPLLGRQLANFRIERLLGRGGMASVYYGWDVKLERPVAIKVIDARYQADPEYARRFVNEARTVATWRHENILQIHYADDQDGLYYFVMEYIRGLDLGQLLRQYLEAGELMPQADVLRMGQAVASALDYAHARGVIHRDVKPSNVLIAEDGRVVLADFGLALSTGQGTLGQVFGSPHYVAPEQARNSAEAVPQSDLYALGVMLYEMLTGSVPFDDPSPMALALQHVTLRPPPPRQLNPALSEAVENVLLKALDKDPAGRYSSGQALINALQAALQTPVAGPASPPPHPAACYPK